MEPLSKLESELALIGGGARSKTGNISTVSAISYLKRSLRSTFVEGNTPAYVTDAQDFTKARVVQNEDGSFSSTVSVFTSPLNDSASVSRGSASSKFGRRDYFPSESVRLTFDPLLPISSVAGGNTIDPISPSNFAVSLSNRLFASWLNGFNTSVVLLGDEGSGKSSIALGCPTFSRGRSGLIDSLLQNAMDKAQFLTRQALSAGLTGSQAHVGISIGITAVSFEDDVIDLLHPSAKTTPRSYNSPNSISNTSTNTISPVSGLGSTRVLVRNIAEARSVIANALLIRGDFAGGSDSQSQVFNFSLSSRLEDVFRNPIELFGAETKKYHLFITIDLLSVVPSDSTKSNVSSLRLLSNPQSKRSVTVGLVHSNCENPDNIKQMASISTAFDMNYSGNPQIFNKASYSSPKTPRSDIAGEHQNQSRLKFKMQSKIQTQIGIPAPTNNMLARILTHLMTTTVSTFVSVLGVDSVDVPGATMAMGLLEKASYIRYRAVRADMHQFDHKFGGEGISYLSLGSWWAAWIQLAKQFEADRSARSESPTPPKNAKASRQPQIRKSAIPHNPGNVLLPRNQYPTSIPVYVSNDSASASVTAPLSSGPTGTGLPSLARSKSPAVVEAKSVPDWYRSPQERVTHSQGVDTSGSASGGRLNVSFATEVSTSDRVKARIPADEARTRRSIEALDQRLARLRDASTERVRRSSNVRSGSALRTGRADPQLNNQLKGLKTSEEGSSVRAASEGAEAAENALKSAFLQSYETELMSLAKRTGLTHGPLTEKLVGQSYGLSERELSVLEISLGNVRKLANASSQVKRNDFESDDSDFVETGKDTGNSSHKLSTSRTDGVEGSEIEREKYQQGLNASQITNEVADKLLDSLGGNLSLIRALRELSWTDSSVASEHTKSIKSQSDKINVMEKEDVELFSEESPLHSDTHFQPISQDLTELMPATTSLINHSLIRDTELQPNDLELKDKSKPMEVPRIPNRVLVGLEQDVTTNSIFSLPQPIVKDGDHSKIPSALVTLAPSDENGLRKRELSVVEEFNRTTEDIMKGFHSRHDPTRDVVHPLPKVHPVSNATKSEFGQDDPRLGSSIQPVSVLVTDSSQVETNPGLGLNRVNASLSGVSGIGFRQGRKESRTKGYVPSAIPDPSLSTTMTNISLSSTLNESNVEEELRNNINVSLESIVNASLRGATVVKPVDKLEGYELKSGLAGGSKVVSNAYKSSPVRTERNVSKSLGTTYSSGDTESDKFSSIDTSSDFFTSGSQSILEDRARGINVGRRIQDKATKSGFGQKLSLVPFEKTAVPSDFVTKHVKIEALKDERRTLGRLSPHKEAKLRELETELNERAHSEITSGEASSDSTDYDSDLSLARLASSIQITGTLASDESS